METARADQIGSLLWGQLFAGQLAPEGLEEIEDQAIERVLQRQQQTGIGVCTDGEFRRIVYLTSLAQAVDGFVMGQGDTLRAHAVGPFKITVPSPMHFVNGSWKKGISDAAYPTPYDLLSDITRILSEEAAQLAAEGVPYIQVDSPTYTQFLDAEWDEWFAAHGMDKDRLLDEAIASDNAILDAAHAGGAVTAVHLCRGNGMGAWLSSGGYDAIAEKVFALHADRLLLEYDTERAGTFDALRAVASDKVVVLGLVSTKVSALESREDLRRRIEEAPEFVPMERLALSPQCGFASDFRGNPIAEDDQWRKLELVASVANEIWGSVPVRI